MIPILRVKINSVYYMIPVFKQKIGFYSFFSLSKVITSPIPIATLGLTATTLHPCFANSFFGILGSYPCFKSLINEVKSLIEDNDYGKFAETIFVRLT